MTGVLVFAAGVVLGSVAYWTARTRRAIRELRAILAATEAALDACEEARARHGIVAEKENRG